MKRKTSLPPKPVRSPQVPVTVAMLNEMEGRLSHKIDSVKSGLKAEIAGVRSELKAEIAGVRSELSEVKSDLVELKSDMSGVKSELHRVALLVEEQNARNKFVLDGYAQLYELIERKLG